jgi:hypothetical protein
MFQLSGGMHMSSVTYCVVLPFSTSETGDLIPGQPVEKQSANSACSYARAIVAAGTVGAIAFQRTGDPALGEFEDAVILSREGVVPDDFLFS